MELPADFLSLGRGSVKDVQQIEFYNMDVVLQNFRRSFGSSTPFFHLLSLDPPVTMEELYNAGGQYPTSNPDSHDQKSVC